MGWRSADPSDVRFWRRSLHAGVALSLVTCCFVAAYCLLSWDRPNRAAILLLVGAAFLLSIGLVLAPLDGVLRTPRRWIFFASWSATLIPLVAILVALDGGAHSPLAAVFFLPLTFAALAYPLMTMLLVGAGVVLAYLVVALDHPHEGAGVVAFACALATAAWMCAWQARLHDRQRSELARVSRADPLTACLNRRGLHERAAAELGRATRHGRPLSLVLIDLDHFKAVNDRDGHAAGDALLCWTVERIHRSIRPMDAVGRLGGDEFAVLLPDAGPGEAAEVAARIVAALGERTGASSGTATFPAEGSGVDELHAVADARLYAAKDGRPGAAGHDLAWAAALARAVDARMTGNESHSGSVADLAVAMGVQLGWDGARLQRLRLAAMLHDVGKAVVPDAVLTKPGPLDPAERDLVHRHPEAGAEIVSRIAGLDDVAEWIRHSHEHVDGSGYPRGLRGEEIPMGSRIVLVADAFDAMTSERVYRRAIPRQAALAELERHAGTQFDPRCVRALVDHLRDADEAAAA